MSTDEAKVSLSASMDTSEEVKIQMLKGEQPNSASDERPPLVLNVRSDGTSLSDSIVQLVSCFNWIFCLVCSLIFDYNLASAMNFSKELGEIWFRFVFLVAPHLWLELKKFIYELRAASIPVDT